MDDNGAISRAHYQKLSSESALDSSHNNDNNDHMPGTSTRSSAPQMNSSNHTSDDLITKPPDTQHTGQAFFTSLGESLSQRPVWKLLLAIIYFLFVMFLLSLFLVVVHIRQPDPQLFPYPLPDIVLDYFPRVLWGLDVTEALITTMTITTAVVILFHQHGIILLRRLLCMIATLFFYRAFCVLSTQLTQSNSDLHKYCPPMNYTGVLPFLQRAGQIMLGAGMRQNGGQTCGDYMFSGHTVTLTLGNLMFVYYTPWEHAGYIVVKMLSCILNVVGVICILAAHEHYTVDVIVGFLLTLLIFNDYHHIANCSELRQRERTRILLTSPIVYLMECDEPSPVVNRMRIPLWQSWLTYRSKRQQQQQQSDQTDPTVLP